MTDHELTRRITAYLTGGGLFNPEMANHERVRDLLIDCRDALAQPEQDHGFDRTASHMAGEYVDTAQPEQEPVNIHCPSCLHYFSIVPVAKREWVGLTGEEVDAIRKDIFEKYKNALVVTRDVTNENNYSAFNFYQAIEKKLRSKND